MKNKKGFLLFGLLTLISCFFCIGDVEAVILGNADITSDFITSSFNNYYQDKGKSGYKLYDIKDFPYVFCFLSSEGSSNGYSYTQFYCYYSPNIPIFTVNSSNRYTVNINDYSNFYNEYGQGAPSFYAEYWKDSFSFLNTSTRWGSTNFTKSNLEIVSNFDIYVNGDLFQTKNLDYNPGPTSFEYSEIINTNLIDSVEFRFIDIPLNETGIVYNFDFSSVFSDGSYSETQFSQPFGREYYTGCDEETQSCSSSLKSKDYLFYDLDFVSRHYEYLDVKIFNDSAEHITSSYSVILPLENDIGKYIDLFFYSDYEYEVIIHYKSDEGSTSSYLETIDITNKYGVVFLPWYDDDIYVDEDTFYLTDFKVVGNVDIQVTDSRDANDYNILQLYSMNYCNHAYQEQIDIPYNCDNLTGIFKFKIDNLITNQTLRFVNHAYSTSQGTKTLITYDTRYFNYTILDTPYSIGEVIDPVTGEKHNINLNDFYNQFNNYSNSGFKSALNRFLNPIKFIFKNITSLFNNYLNTSLQDYFFFAFSLMLIILILRVIF